MSYTVMMRNAKGNRKLFKLPLTLLFIMAGRIEDNGIRQRDCYLKNISADFLLSRLKYLINDINVSLGLISLNSLNPGSVGTILMVDDQLALRQEISEFLGLVVFMRAEHGRLLLPYRTQINSLKLRLGVYFV